MLMTASLIDPYNLMTIEENYRGSNKVGALGRHLGDEIWPIQMFCPPSEETQD